MTHAPRSPRGNGNARVVSIRLIRASIERHDGQIHVGDVVAVEVAIGSTHPVECVVAVEPAERFRAVEGEERSTVGPTKGEEQRRWALRAVEKGDASVSVRAGTQLTQIPLRVV